MEEQGPIDFPPTLVRFDRLDSIIVRPGLGIFSRIPFAVTCAVAGGESQEVHFGLCKLLQAPPREWF